MTSAPISSLAAATFSNSGRSPPQRALTWSNGDALRGDVTLPRKRVRTAWKGVGQRYWSRDDARQCNWPRWGLAVVWSCHRLTSAARLEEGAGPRAESLCERCHLTANGPWNGRPNGTPLL